MLPEKLCVAGPVIITWLFSSQEINKSPPRREMVLWRGEWPVKAAATSVAHVPVPHASVSPHPRSYTRNLGFLSVHTTNSILHLAGKTGWDSKKAPIFSRSNVSNVRSSERKALESRASKLSRKQRKNFRRNKSYPRITFILLLQSFFHFPVVIH